MKKLIAKVSTQQRSGLNPKTLFVYENQSGTVGYRYTNSGGTSFAISNMQCGWRGPNLPDCIYDYTHSNGHKNRVCPASHQRFCRFPRFAVTGKHT